MASVASTYITPEEYLEQEREAETRSEYFRGEVFAMSGGTYQHSVIVANLIGELRDRLRKTPCKVTSSDLRLAIASANLYTYPDVMVICGDPVFVDQRSDTVLNPVLIIEVLSGSTRNYDRAQKFKYYRTLSSFSEYLTVAQDEVHIEQYTRQPDGRWMLAEYTDLLSPVPLASISVEIQLSDVYEKVEFEDRQAP